MIKAKGPFLEPCPKYDVNDPNWSKAFSEWIVRKAAHYDMGPWEFLGRSLGMRERDLKKARKLDNKHTK